MEAVQEELLFVCCFSLKCFFHFWQFCILCSRTHPTIHMPSKQHPNETTLSPPTWSSPTLRPALPTKLTQLCLSSCKMSQLQQSSKSPARYLLWKVTQGGLQAPEEERLLGQQTSPASPETPIINCCHDPHAGVFKETCPGI